MKLLTSLDVLNPNIEVVRFHPVARCRIEVDMNVVGVSLGPRRLPLAFSLSHSVGKVRIALVLVLGHLVLEHDHLHLLVHLDLGLVLRFHGLASLYSVRVFV